MLLTKNCVVCDKKYQTYHNRSKYCSGSCRVKFRRDQKLDHETRICLACGKEFSVNKYFRTKYCSIKCGKSIVNVPKQKGYAVYFIKNKINNKLYVGSTKNFKIRIIQHKSDLNLNRHSNSRLQLDCNLYGSKSFEFIIAEENIKSDQRYEKEQYYIDCYNLSEPDKGYNIAINARCAMKNRKHSKESLELMSIAHKNISDETRLKMSKSQKGRKRSLESIEKTVSKLRGVPRSEEIKIKISKSQSGSKCVHSKLSYEDVLDIKKRLNSNEKQKDIAKTYNIHPSVISKIVHNKRYKEDLL